MTINADNIRMDFIDDIKQFKGIGLDKIKESIDLINKNKNLTNRDSLKKYLLCIMSEEESILFCKVILRFYGTYESKKSSPKEFVKNIFGILEKKDKDLYENVKDIEEYISELINLTQIKIIYDSACAEISSERILSEVNISTSIRPIFTKENNEILSSVISHTIEIIYASETRDISRISLLLDRGDIEKIKTSCDNALERETFIKNNQRKFNICDSK